jgi:hypothetical protein
MWTISGTDVAHSRTIAKGRSSQSGSAMMLIATVKPSLRAMASALKLSPRVTRLRCSFSPHVAPRFQEVLLPDASAFQLAPDGEAVVGLDEGDGIDQEHVRLGDAGEIVGRALRRDLPVAPAVERPRAAGDAVPGAAARERRGRAGIEHAEEVPPAAPRELAGGWIVLEVLEQCGTRPGAHRRHHPRQRRQPVVADRVEDSGTDDFASPRTTQSIAPSACSSDSGAMNEALWPPTKTKGAGWRRSVSRARSSASARWRDSSAGTRRLAAGSAGAL